MAVKQKDPAAVALGRKGGKKGGYARAASMTPKQRSESARKAVEARWARAAEGSDDKVVKKTQPGKKFQLRKDLSEATPTAPTLDTSRKALHLCLKRIKSATDENELHRLTEELQRIVFHKQYLNA